MTPERVRELAYENASEMWLMRNMERAIRQAVNEALEEAAKVCTDFGAMYCRNAIRALKLPEEP